jgi:signal transduction histidine kinase
LRENLDFALDLTSDLIRVARGPSASPPPASIRDLAAQARHFVQGLVPNTVRLSNDVSGVMATDLNVAIKPRHLLQILSNFVANAMDAMDRSGDLKLRWSLTNVSLKQAETLQLAPGDYLRIDVEDNGRGMDEATLLEIFEVYFTTKADEGTGLGLAISQSIARDAGGVITAQSRPGEGSMFSIHLPTIQAV